MRHSDEPRRLIDASHSQQLTASITYVPTQASKQAQGLTITNHWSPFYTDY
jgi:hypothetical protein